MKINDLSYNATGARYGYNGTHEQDLEVNANGNYLDFGNFGYDTRVARRFNLDPIDQIFISNYAGFGNNPIFFSDPTGWAPENDLISDEVVVEAKADVKPTPEAGAELKEYLEANKNNIVERAEKFKPIVFDRPESSAVTIQPIRNEDRTNTFEFVKNNEFAITTALEGAGVGLYNSNSNQWLGVTKSFTPSYYSTNFYSNQYMINSQLSTIKFARGLGNISSGISALLIFQRVIDLPNSDHPYSESASIGLDIGIIAGASYIGGPPGFLFGVGASTVKMITEDELKSYYSLTPSRGSYLTPTDATTVNVPIK